MSFILFLIIYIITVIIIIPISILSATFSLKVTLGKAEITNVPLW